MKIEIGKKYRIDKNILKEYIKKCGWDISVLHDIKKFNTVTVKAVILSDNISLIYNMTMYDIEETNQHYYPEICFKSLRLKKLKRILCLK